MNVCVNSDVVAADIPDTGIALRPLLEGGMAVGTGWHWGGKFDSADSRW